ncbi:MAG: hypothetical protein G01um101413_13 [Parcubacteria group bacterium Gr01-1014_13]|nr:MAG: hypothetical protein G01um101413_13 [Parcubacteria group bacterium Gr01-1014_13]
MMMVLQMGTKCVAAQILKRFNFYHLLLDYMFDEQNQNSGAPKNLPAEPVDMFAGVEKDEGKLGQMPPSSPDALSAGRLSPKGAPAIKKEEAPISPHLSNVGHELKMSTPILGKILLFLAVVLLLGGLAYGGWWFMYGSKNKSAKLPATTTEQTVQNQTSGVTNTTNIPAQINNDQILFGQAVDSDKDGLDDVREKEIGTDPQKLDSDIDGLNDGDEVIIYKTNPLFADTDTDGLSDGDEILIWRSNPLNMDTDGDSYKDGEEVRNGYSPVGPGKLFSAPSSTATGT